jgi:competence ComEA-like helix-hairpin-helix protein
MVANGLARVYGAASDPPGMDRAEVEWRKLRQLERKAREQKIGGWGIATGRLSARSVTQPAPSNDSFDAFFHSKAPEPATPAPSAPAGTRLDVNTASMGALQNISGVGNILARRIIDARPFKSADDLRQVKGIGDKRYEKLRPYFE